MFGILSLIFVQFAPFRGATVGAVDVITHHTSPFVEEWRQFTPAENPLQTDQTDGIALAAAFWGDIQEGDLRMWEPDLGTGAPIGGVIYTRVWSPFYWVGAFVPPAVLSSVAVWLTLWCAQMGAWALARYLGVGPLGSLLSGVAFGFSGPSTALLLRINEIAVAPWVFLGVHLTVDRGRVRPPAAVAVLAAAVAAMWLGGFPAASIFTLYGAAAIAIGASILHVGWRPSRLVKRLALPLSGVVAGTALVAPLLLPSYEFLRHSESLNRSYASSHAAGIEMFGSSLSGRILGTYQHGTWWWPDPGYSSPVEASMTIGTVVLVVLSIAVFCRTEEESPSAVGIISKLYLPVGAVIFIGTFIGGPLLATLQLLPFVGSNSFGRSRFMLSLAIALAAGIGLEALLRAGKGRRLHPQFRVLTGLFVALGVIGGAVILARAVEEDMVDRLMFGLSVPALCTGIGLVGYMIYRSASPRSAVLHYVVAGGLVLLTAVELQWGAWEFTPVMEPEEGFYPRHEMFEVMTPSVTDGTFRFAGTQLNVVRPNSGALLDMSDLRISNPSYGRYRELMRTVDPKVFERARLRTWFTDALEPSSVGLDRSSVKYLIAPASAGILEAEKTETANLQEGSIRLKAGEPIRGLGLLLPEMSCDIGHATLLQNGQVVGRRPLWQVEKNHLAVAVEDLRGPSVVSVAVDECGGQPAEPVTVFRAERDTQLQAVWADDAVLYSRDNALPRFELATTIVGVEDRATRLEMLLDQEHADITFLDSKGGRQELHGGSVELLADSGDHLRLRVSAEGRGLLIVRDANAPGWKAEIDGQPTGIVHADHAYRGVWVPNGTSIVEMTYAPVTRTIGLLLATASLALFGGVTWWWRRSAPSIG